MRASCLLLPAVVILALVLERPATAASPPPVSLDALGCPNVPAAGLRRMIAAEMGAALLQDDPFDDKVTRVIVTCTADAALIELHDPVTGKSLARQVQLVAGPPDSVTRLLALSSVELIAASWIELAVERRPLTGKVARLVPPSPPLRAAASELSMRDLRPHDAWRFTLHGASRGFADGGLRTYGGSVVMERIWAETLVLSLDVTVENAAVKTELGDGNLQLASAGVGGALRSGPRVLSIEVGAGARAGIVRQRGVPGASNVQGFTSTEPWWGPFGTVRTTFRPLSHLVLAASGELGVVVREVIGLVDGQPRVQVHGPWVMVLLGAGVMFD